MEEKIILISLLIYFKIFVNVFGGIQPQSDLKDDQNLAKFIGELIRDANMKDLSRVHDVVLFRVEDESRSDLIEEIFREIPKETSLMMPDFSLTVNNQRIHVASFIIIISDVTDAVS